MTDTSVGLRIGVLSDTHLSLIEGDTAEWHGPLDLQGAKARLDAALELLRPQGIDVLVVSGDLTNHGDRASTMLAIESLERFPTPVVVVPGNHDVIADADMLTAVVAARPDSNVRLASDEGEVLAPGVRLAGRGEQPSSGRELAAPVDVAAWGRDLVIWVSHFPVASLREVCDRVGLLYAGDADDCDEAIARLAGRDGPTIALSGHLHVRHCEAIGNVLQLGAGALVEAPGDVAIVTIDRHPTTTVRRRTWATDVPSGARLPVLAPVDETFSLTASGEWARESAADGPALRVSAYGLAVLAFDWNGTLVDDSEAAWHATVRVLAQRGLAACSRSDFSHAFRLPLPVFFGELGVDDPQSAADEWNAHMGDTASDLMPGARATLAQLRAAGIAIAVVSAADAAVVRRQVARFGLEGQLDFIEAGAPTKRQALGELAQLAPGRVAFLGDTEYDIHEACAAGVRAWGFAGGYRPPEALLDAGAERVLESLLDVWSACGLGNGTRARPLVIPPPARSAPNGAQRARE